MTTGATVVTVAAVTIVAAPHAAAAQAPQPELPRSVALVRPDPLVRESTPVPWYSALASGLLPGSGQLATGRDRGALYVIAEAVLLTRFLSFHREGRRERDLFRELALTVARGPFEPAVRDTSFEYFEELSRFIESGPFDTDPGPGVVPPIDERTFNGSVWALARRTFFADPDVIPDQDSPEYQRAIEFYRSRAVGPNFLWSWRNAGLEQDLYRQSIQRSDEAFRTASQQLGLMMANHLLSAIDAFIAHRLSRAGRRVSLASTVWPVADGLSDPGATVVLTLRF